MIINEIRSSGGWSAYQGNFRGEHYNLVVVKKLSQKVVDPWTLLVLPPLLPLEGGRERRENEGGEREGDQTKRREGGMRWQGNTATAIALHHSPCGGERRSSL